MDYDLGFVMLNYLADFWDLSDQYNLLYNRWLSSIFQTNPVSKRPNDKILEKFSK
jgi:hypothetical protein